MNRVFDKKFLKKPQYVPTPHIEDQTVYPLKNLKGDVLFTGTMSEILTWSKAKYEREWETARRQVAATRGSLGRQSGTWGTSAPAQCSQSESCPSDTGFSSRPGLLQESPL